MGGSNSKQEPTDKKNDFLDRIRSTVNDEVARRMMIQREVQLAVNLAQARDTIWIYGNLWATFTGGLLTARALGRPVPPIAGIPVVLGAIVLGNMADLAYGNKLARVCKEAEYILDNERGRFVPFKQAAFAKFYTPEEKAAIFDSATAVGDLFPNNLFAHSVPLPGPAKKGESSK